MKPVRTWIVIADGAQVKVFRNDGPSKGLTAVSGREARIRIAPSRELGSDRPGRVHDRQSPGRHAMVPRVDRHEQERAGFAKEVAAMVDRAAQRNAFDRLVLVAAPKTLGSLRAALKPQTLELVHGELAKDLTGIPPKQLPEHLSGLLPI